MANKHRKHRRRGSRRRNRRYHARSRNPVRSRGRVRRFRRRYAGNPFGVGTTTLLKDALTAIGGGVVTRTLPEALLPRVGVPNEGFVGYLANFVAAWAASAAASKFISPDAGRLAMLGGVMATVGRIAEDYLKYQAVQFGTFPIGRGVSGLRGDFQRSGFLVPASSTPGGRLALPPPPVAAGVSGAFPRSAFGRSAWAN